MINWIYNVSSGPNKKLVFKKNAKTSLNVS